MHPLVPAKSGELHGIPTSVSDRFDVNDMAAVLKRVAKEAQGAPFRFGSWARGNAFDALALIFWVPYLADFLRISPQYLPLWDLLKAAFVKAYDKHPRANPWYDDKHTDAKSAAEVSATSLKRLMAWLRRCKLRWPEMQEKIMVSCAEATQIIDVIQQIDTAVVETPRKERQRPPSPPKPRPRKTARAASSPKGTSAPASSRPPKTPGAAASLITRSAPASSSKGA